MNLKDLSKEQKQYLILGAVVIVAVVGAIVVGVKFSLSSIGEARVELLDLTGKIERADRSLKNNQRDESALFETISELKVYLEKIPPDQNYYSWATEVIYGNAREASLEIDAINESGTISKGQSKKAKNEVSVESYSLRIIAHGGYESIKQFLLDIRKKHPLVRITGLEISTGSSSEIHDVQLFVQWPFKLDHMVAAWKDIPAKHPVETVVSAPEPSVPEPGKTPTPPAPRISPEPKPIVQPTAVASPKPAVPIEEDVKEEQLVKPEEKQKEITTPVVEETLPEPEVSAPREKPKETSKSANRLEALLGR